MKSILYVTDINFNTNDAPAVHAVNFINYIPNNIEVTLIAPFGIKISIINRKVKFVNLLRVHSFALKSITMNIIGLILGIFEIMRNKPDCIYVRYSPYLIFPVILSRIFKIKIATEINGAIKYESGVLNLSHLSIKMALMLEKFIFKNNDLLITVSEGLNAYLITNYAINPRKIFVQENGVNTDLFHPVEQSKAQKKLNLDPTYKYITFVGSFQKWHGLNYIVEALSIVKCTCAKNIKLLLVGKGNEYANIKHKVEELNVTDDVIFAGSVNNENVPDYINASNICISYITKDLTVYASPFKIYEYLACNKKVIASDFQMPDEILKNYCVFVEAENPPALAEAICNNIEKSDFVDERMRDLVVSKHSWKVVVDNILTQINFLV